MRIAVAVFEGVEELDWVGPWEVLATWARGWPDDAVTVITVGDDPQPITCAKGAKVVVDCTWEALGPIDVLVYPGGQGVRRQLGEPRIRRRLVDIADKGTLMTSVCTGALAYAAAGLLDHRPATTHWSALEDLKTLGKDIEVRADVRFVDAGSVVTAAGVSAGIDMALHLVARLHSIERAREVRRRIQYDPMPPV